MISKVYSNYLIIKLKSIKKLVLGGLNPKESLAHNYLGVPPTGSPHSGLRFARCFARFAPTCGSRTPTPYDIMFPQKMCSKSSLQAAHAPPT
jgi:hypothetical protein